MRIGVIGSSHLGLVWSNVLAAKGFTVYNLASKYHDVYEPGLDELSGKHIKEGRLFFPVQYAALKECDVVFFAVDTRTTYDNKAIIGGLNNHIESVICHLNNKATLVIMSQVPPGFMRGIDFPHKRLFHQVDTLVFGESIERALNPDYVVVGYGHTPEDTQIYLSETPKDYRIILDHFDCPILRVSYEEAEVYKLAMNANLAAQIGVTNTMAELCSHVGADWKNIRPLLERDKRIGSYTKPGLGIGGGHIERDLNTIVSLSDTHGFNSDIIKSSLSNSHYMRNWALRILKNTLLVHDSDPQIALWGLTYKTGTNSTKDSPGALIADELEFHILNKHDPLIENTKFENPLDCLRNGSPRNPKASGLLIMTPHEEYKNIDPMDIIELMELPCWIIDPYRVLDRNVFTNISKDFNYYTLGVL